MIVSNYVLGDEKHSIYAELAEENNARLLSFVRSLVKVAKEEDKLYLSQTLLKAMNFHAIACLHIKAGEYRPCEVQAGELTIPPYYQVPDLMDDFINNVNRTWEQPPPIALAAYVLWKLVRIHPFVNGNGRTARAACYFVLCLCDCVSLDHTPAIPDLLDDHREEYINALLETDESYSKKEGSQIALVPIIALLEKLINKSSIPSRVEQVRASYQYKRTSSQPLPHARGSDQAGTLVA